MFDVSLELRVTVEDLNFWKGSSTHDSQKAVRFRVHLEGVPDDDKNDVWQDAKFGKEEGAKRKRKLGEIRALHFRKKSVDWTLEHCRPSEMFGGWNVSLK